LLITISRKTQQSAETKEDFGQPVLSEGLLSQLEEFGLLLLSPGPDPQIYFPLFGRLGDQPCTLETPNSLASAIRPSCPLLLARLPLPSGNQVKKKSGFLSSESLQNANKFDSKAAGLSSGTYRQVGIAIIGLDLARDEATNCGSAHPTIARPRRRLERLRNSPPKKRDPPLKEEAPMNSFNHKFTPAVAAAEARPPPRKGTNGGFSKRS
jgi:hypothetical protein